MRHADQIRMQADRHDPAGLRALGVERIELAFYRSDELLDRAVARLQKRRIVDLVGIGDRDQLSAADIHEERLVVADPVGDILDAVVGQIVERVPGLGQTRAEPAGRLPAGQRLDLVQRAGDRLPLLVRLHLIEPARIGLVVAEDFPAQFDAARTICGWWSQMSLFIVGLARTPYFCSTSMMRQMPTRLP